MWLWSVKSVRTSLPKIESYPVQLEFTFYLHPTVLDGSNCSYMGKMIEDSLVAIGTLQDDSPKYVDSVIYRSRRIAKTEPEHCVLEIHQINHSPEV